MRPSFWPSLGFVAVLLSAAPARAEPQHAFQLDYVRGKGAGVCPDVSVLRKELVDIMGYDPVKPTAPKKVSAIFERSRGELTGIGILRDDAGHVVWQTDLISTTSPCPILVGAVALAIDARLGRPKAPEPPPRPPEPPPKPVACPPPEAPRPCPACPAQVEKVRNVSGYAGLDALGSFGVTLTPSLGAGGFVGVRLREPTLSFEVGARLTGTLVGTDIPITTGPVARIRSAFAAGMLAGCGHVRFVFLCAMGGVGAAMFISAPGAHVPSSSAPFGIAGMRIGAQHAVAKQIDFRYFVELAALFGSARLEGAEAGAAWVKPPGMGSMGLGITFDPW